MNMPCESIKWKWESWQRNSAEKLRQNTKKNSRIQVAAQQLNEAFEIQTNTCFPAYPGKVRTCTVREKMPSKSSSGLGSTNLREHTASNGIPFFSTGMWKQITLDIYRISWNSTRSNFILLHFSVCELRLILRPLEEGIWSYEKPRVRTNTFLVNYFEQIQAS